MFKLLLFIIPTLYISATYSCNGGNCCTTPECIERNYLSNQGINKLTKMIDKVINHESSQQKKMIRQVNRKLAFLDRLSKKSKAPRLKKLYKQCKQRILNNYKRQVGYEYHLDSYDPIGGYREAKAAVKRLKKTRHYRNSRDINKLRRYQNDLQSISAYLQSKRLDNPQDYGSDYHFMLNRQSCDFSSLFKTTGDDPGIYSISYELTPKEMKSGRYQKILERAARKPIKVDFSYSCFFGKNKVYYSTKKNSFHFQVKGAREGGKCIPDRRIMEKYKGVDYDFTINPIRVLVDDHVVK